MLRLLALSLFLALGAAASAQPGPGGNPGTPGAPIQSVPLDGGLTLLAVAGGAYAFRRLRQPGDDQ